MSKPDPQLLRRYAKRMRSEPTVGEWLLWHEIRAKRLGVKFRRQVPIGPFIPDFVCFSKRLIIEVDGDSHDDPEKDRRRDRWFIAQGWFVLRIPGYDVAQRMEYVLDLVLLAIEDPTQIEDPLNETWRG
jgi:very-short-patch-repair endonuclease